MAMTAHSVLEELLLYLCDEEARALIEVSAGADELGDDEDSSDAENWVFALFDDMDIITFLYSDMYLDADDSYHFDHWNDQQFFMDR
jgi:hypothetical protein